MITKKSIIISESLALAYKNNALKYAGPVIRGLSDLSFTGLEYGADYRNEIATATLESDEHNHVMAVVSDKLAEMVKSAYAQINQYGVAYLEALKEGISSEVWNRDYYRTATQDLYVRYICIDNDFFTSLVYPTKVANESLSYKSIDLSVLSRLECGNVQESDIQEYMKSGHPDVNRLLEESDVHLSTSMENLFSRDAMEGMFFHDKGLFDFTRVKTLDVYAVIQMWLLASKMYGNEDPVKYLTKGDLNSYRSYIGLVWNGLTNYLIVLKRHCDMLRNRGIVMTQDEVSGVRQMCYGDTGRQEDSYAVLFGKVTVTYSEANIRNLEQNERSLSDWVMARLITNSQGNGGISSVDLCTSEVALRAVEDFISRISTATNNNARRLVQESWFHTTVAFVNKDETLRELANSIPNRSGIAGEKLANKMAADVHWGGMITGAYCNRPASDLGEILMSSGVVTHFLRAIECDTAAEILAGTEALSNDDTLIDKRKRLHLSIINVLVKKLSVK